jgi:hypothetical protein
VSGPWSGLAWPFPVGPPADTSELDFEPTDAQLGGAPAADPYDSPSYSTLTTKGSTK